ncbi:MAG TPA: SAM-dependent DNA methyltransferase, partial [bacterium]|nr:SAM-dependent DNA methyltransferase [bacterium]
ENKNGIWARIIKNAFAPLFVGKVDYVAGNPPWVNWESLPDGYRQGMIPLWQEYGLFTLSGSAGRMGGGKKDLAMIFVYSAVDNYLDEGGKLGFVITQTVFKTHGAGDGFRQLQFPKGRRTVFLKPLAVHDLSSMQVFEGATNRTAVFVCEKRRRAFSYPVSYIIWRGPSRIHPDCSLADVRSSIHEVNMGAAPIDPEKKTSPWLTAPKRVLYAIQKVIGKSAYRAYEGSNTCGLNGCFWVRILHVKPNGELLIENLNNIGKIKIEQVQAVVEPDLVYPLLRGRDVQRWHAEPSAHILLAQDPDTRKGIPESVMKIKYRRTFAYLKQFEGDPQKPERGTLRGRSGYRKYFKPTDPFYSMFNVGPYTMAKWKVLWPEVGHTVRAAVCGPSEVEERKPCLPDHTVIAVSCHSANEAHYIAGLLNSSPARIATASYIVLHPSPHVMENIAIPHFEPKKETHKHVATLSRKCHTATAKGDLDTVAALEAEIDRAAAELWGIGDAELRGIQDAILELPQREGDNPGDDEMENEDEE